MVCSTSHHEPKKNDQGTFISSQVLCTFTFTFGVTHQKSNMKIRQAVVVLALGTLLVSLVGAADARERSSSSAFHQGSTVRS